MRGLGIVLVVAYHLWTSGRVSGGVDVFLFISAFLMTGSFVRKGTAFTLIDFLVQRFRRLVPLASIVVIVTLLARHGYTPVLCTQTPGGVHEDEYVQMLLDRGVSGIIYISGLHADTARYRSKPSMLRAEPQAVPSAFISSTTVGLP